jgi:uncharacterized protein YgiM (DUF1202 family)
MKNFSFRTLGVLIIFSNCIYGTGAPAADPPAFGWPYNSPALFRTTAGFDLDPATSDRADWTGWKSADPTGGSGHSYDGHAGTDLGVPTGTSVFASAAGNVYALRESVPNDDHSDTGNYIILNNPNVGGRAYQTLFWHLQQNGVIPASTGVNITKGQQIAFSDNTGNSTGPHLHYEIELLGEDSTCPYYHCWWENDEFYYGDQYPCLVYLAVNPTDGLNCREGASTSYNIVTSWPYLAKAVGSQRNGWWRVFLPLPQAWVVESRNAAGNLSPSYSETGTWSNSTARSNASEPEDDPNRTSLTALGSRVSTFGTTGDAGDTATFNFTVPNQRGNYDVYATWPSDANAANVTYRINDASGAHNVVVNQSPAAAVSAGTGTKADPYRILSNPYVANHTTVGAPDEWTSYSPTGSGIPENGPERLYRFDLTATGEVTIDVTHTGYPTKDIDLQLLTSASPGSCIARADFTISQTLAAGTYYIAADSYGSNNNAATAYTIRVEFNGVEPFADSWTKLGTFTYAANGVGSVQVQESSVTGKVDSSKPAKVYADAIKIVPRITYRSAWFSDGFASRIDTSATPVPSVVIKTDKTAYNDSNIMAEAAEVPIYSAAAAGTSNSSAIVGKAVTGQRFVLLSRSGDWYQVQLTNGTSAQTGWILGDHLYAYKQNLASSVADWNLY